MKRCAKCGERKPLSAFPPRGKSRPGKRYSECVSCRRARALQAEMSRRLIREYAARWRYKTRHLVDAANIFIEKSSKREFRLLKYYLMRHHAILAYGGYRCACCGMREALFLTIDHINNDGGRHRRRVGPTTRFLLWLRRKGYPPGFQVLCSNCNHGRHRNGGVCPHQDPVGKKSAFMAVGRVRMPRKPRRRASAASKSRTRR
jgi:hypothetical protein